MLKTIKLMQLQFNTKEVICIQNSFPTLPSIKKMLEWLGHQFDAGVQSDKLHGNFREVAIVLVKDSEDKIFPILTPNSIDAIGLKIQEKGFLH